jgi:hypothetical protein
VSSARTSSGSIDSARPVNPTRSQKTTVTSFRSCRPRSGRSGVAQLAQKFASSGFSRLQLGHTIEIENTAFSSLVPRRCRSPSRLDLRASGEEIASSVRRETTRRRRQWSATGCGTAHESRSTSSDGKKAPPSGAFLEPSSGLEPLTPPYQLSCHGAEAYARLPLIGSTVSVPQWLAGESERESVTLSRPRRNDPSCHDGGNAAELRYVCRLDRRARLRPAGANDDARPAAFHK